MTKKLKNNWLNSGAACLLLGAAMIPGQMLTATTLCAMEEIQKESVLNKDSQSVLTQILVLRDKKENAEWKYEKIGSKLGNSEEVNNLGKALKKADKKLANQERLNQYLNLIGKGNRDDLVKEIAQDIRLLTEYIVKDAQNSLEEEFTVKRILKNLYNAEFLFDLAVQSLSYDIVRVGLLTDIGEDNANKKVNEKSDLDKVAQEKELQINSANLSCESTIKQAESTYEEIVKKKNTYIKNLELDNETMTGYFKPPRFSENNEAIRLAKVELEKAKVAKDTTINLAQEKKKQEILKAEELYQKAERSYKDAIKKLDENLNTQKSELNELYEKIFTPLGFSYGTKWAYGYDRTALPYDNFDKVIAESNNGIKKQAYEILFKALIKEYNEKQQNSTPGIPVEVLQLLGLDKSVQILKIYQLQEKLINAQLKITLEEKQREELELKTKESINQSDVNQQSNKLDESAQKKTLIIASEEQILPVFENKKEQEGLPSQIIVGEKKGDVSPEDPLLDGMSILQITPVKLKERIKEEYLNQIDDQSFPPLPLLNNGEPKAEQKTVITLHDGGNSKKKFPTRGINSHTRKESFTKSAFRKRRGGNNQGNESPENN
jgi:hypothetical protein